MCYICGRGNCTPSFHSLEEQQAFEPAEEAYAKFIEVRAQCFIDYQESEQEEENEEGEDNE